MQYNWSLFRPSSHSECGTKFDLQHAFSYKKGGFKSLRYNQIKKITALLLTSFKPLVISTTSDIRMSKILCSICRDSQRKVATWICKKMSFSLINSIGLWIRGSRFGDDAHISKLIIKHWITLAKSLIKNFLHSICKCNVFGLKYYIYLRVRSKINYILLDMRVRYNSRNYWTNDLELFLIALLPIFYF